VQEYGEGGGLESGLRVWSDKNFVAKLTLAENKK